MKADQIVRLTLNQDLQTADNISRDIRLYFVLSGDITMTLNDKSYHLKSEDMIVINPGQKAFFEKKECLTAEFVINNNLLLRMMDYKHAYFDCCSVREKNDNFQELRRLMFQLINAQFETAYRELLFQKYSCELLLFLVDNFSINIKFESKEQRLVRDIQTYIESNYTEDISLESVAAYFHYSPQYFSSYFKKTFQMTFLRYVHKIRLEYAYQDLLNTDETILKIALDNGFPNITSFTRIFQETYKEAPNVYRQAHKRERTDLENVPDPDQVRKILKDSFSAAADKKHTMIIHPEKKEALKPYWKMIWNLGTFSQLADADIRSQVKALKEELDFACARVILDSYERKKGNTLLFYEEERVFDFLIDLHVDIMIVIEYRAYSRKEEFPAYLEAMLYNFLNRYGYSHVGKWKFELFYNSDFTGSKAAEYRQFYKILQDLLERVGLKAKIAGPGVLPDKEGTNIRHFLESNPDIEMLTLSAAPYSIEQTDGNTFLSRNTDINYLRNQIEIVYDILETTSSSVQSVCVVDWKDSLTEPDIMNDSCYCAARIIQTAINCYDRIDGLAWSAPLDLLAKEPADNSILSGSPGFICRKGVRKPSFYAYAFLKKLDRYYVYRDAHSFVTCDNEQYYQIICHNCKKLNYKYYMSAESDLNLNAADEYFEDTDAVQTEIKIDAIPNGRYVIKYRSISEDTNILKAWKGLNYFPNNLLGPDETDYLRNISKPVITAEIIEVENGRMSFSFQVKANEIKHIHIIHIY